MNIVQMFLEGGFIMYPLLACSLLIWAIFFEKLWGLRQFKRDYEQLFRAVVPLLKEQKFNEARGLYSSAVPWISAPHLTLFDERKLNKEKREEKIQRKLRETEQGLRKRIWILGTVASMSPFIGLLGTVVGIIKSFDSIAASGKGGFSIVAAGLSEALIATAFGILVAIIASFFYNFFNTRLNEMKIDFRNKLEELTDYLEEM